MHPYIGFKIYPEAARGHVERQVLGFAMATRAVVIRKGLEAEGALVICTTAVPVAPQGTSQGVTMVCWAGSPPFLVFRKRLRQFLPGKSPRPFARVPIVVVTIALRRLGKEILSS